MFLKDKTLNTKMIANVKFGMNIIENELPQSIKNENKKKVFITTDKGLVNSGLIEKLINILNKNKIGHIVFSDVTPNPDANSVMKSVDIYKREECDMIIAIGGGSAMDFGKAVGVVATNPKHILDYQRGKESILNDTPLLFAIPTTIGTGSEVTSISVISDTQANRKFIISSPLLMPEIAFVDPVWTYSLPRHTVAATGIDALVHAIEAYTSVRATPISDGMALQAIKMLQEYLPETYSQPDNLEARSQVHLASTIAGIAFGISGLGLVHSCSHPMSAIYNVPHGIANAVLLPYVIEYNLISNKKKFADIARIFNIKLNMVEDIEASNCLVDLLNNYLKLMDIPKDFGFLNLQLNQNDINKLANDAMDDKGTIPSNPRKVYKEDIIDIYRKVLIV